MIMRRIMVRCGVSTSGSGNVTEQDETVYLAAVEMASSQTTDEIASPFTAGSSVVSDHHLPATRFGGLEDNALVYVSGFVVRKVLRKLSCPECRGSLVTEAGPTHFDQSYHLLTLKNNGGLMFPSEGVVKVVRSAERCIRQGTSGQAVGLMQTIQFVRAEVGSEDIFCLGEHIVQTQHGIDNHHFTLMSSVVSVFHRIRLHYIAKLLTLRLQSGNNRKKII